MTLTWNQYPDRKPDPRWADNWEDDPQRIAHQEWVRSCDHLDKRQKLHRGLVGPGAFLRRIIKENT